MFKWILVQIATGQCFDKATTQSAEQIPFPVHPDFTWVDITGLDPEPQTGWQAVDINGVYQFSTNNPEPAFDPLPYLANYRHEIENGGITIGGVSVRTDTATRTNLLGARIRAEADPQYTLKWKADNGFVTLNASTIIAISDAVANHVQKCFDAEYAVTNLIEQYQSYTAVKQAFDNAMLS